MQKKLRIFMALATSLAIIFTILFFTWFGARIARHVRFEINCTQYLKRAADANTVSLAKQNLEKAISFAEENHLTEGIVSIILHQPRNDVGYWYQNMKEAYSELENISEDATSLEKSNVLIKLRESLADDSGIYITVPDGITIYPNNVFYFWWALLSFILSIVFWLLAYKIYWEY